MDTQTKLDLLFASLGALRESLTFLKKVPNNSPNRRLLEVCIQSSIEALDAEIHTTNTQLMFEVQNDD